MDIQYFLMRCAICYENYQNWASPLDLIDLLFYNKKSSYPKINNRFINEMDLNWIIVCQCMFHNKLILHDKLFRNSVRIRNKHENKNKTMGTVLTSAIIHDLLLLKLK